MEREIKFRAYDDRLMIYSHNNDLNESTMQLSWFFNKVRTDAPIMQFTGLTDKNGKEIYDGDIIKLRTNYLKNAKIEEIEDYGEYIYTVTFFDGMFALAVGLPFNNGFVTGGKMEIIGNIYENPELL